jgi:pimeloyl-ACP methyl ester carboxylesterase
MKVSVRAIGLFALWAWAAAASATEVPCRVPGIRSEVLCGSVARALDPARPEGTQIAVHYVVVPAIARRKLPDPVFLIAGGPGQSAIDVAPSVMPMFYKLAQRRDIVFVDQRGTGRSAPLVCDDDPSALVEQADPARQLARLRSCRDILQKLPYGDLRFFTTTLAMQDLDAVRQARGAERIDLVGVSYGTRAALEYQRQFPDAVRRAVLDGVAPPDMALPASFSTDGQLALAALFTSCEAEAACARAHPTLRADWAALLKSLPRAVTLVDPLDGKPQTVTLTRETVLAMVRMPLYSPLLASALPVAVSEAARGRFQGLATLGGALLSRSGGRLATGMHFSVVCAEDLPRLAANADRPGEDFGDDAVRLYRNACADWPRGAVPDAFYRLSTARSATLLLSGGLDPATPPRHAARVAAALGSQAKHVTVANAGHGVLSVGCMAEVMQRFIDARDDAAALAVDTACAAKLPRPLAFQPAQRASEVAR